MHAESQEPVVDWVSVGKQVGGWVTGNYGNLGGSTFESGTSG